MDGDNASSNKVDRAQETKEAINNNKNAEDKSTPPTTPSPSPSITGCTDAHSAHLHASNKVLGHNYNGTGKLFHNDTKIYLKIYVPVCNHMTKLLHVQKKKEKVQ